MGINDAIIKKLRLREEIVFGGDTLGGTLLDCHGLVVEFDIWALLRRNRISSWSML
jgi:hypothetical protein